MGGFIFEWSDEYWKAAPSNQNPCDPFWAGKQLGGPDGSFKGGAFAGSYADEAGYGVASDVDQSHYDGSGNPISRTLFKGYYAVQTFYTASSHSGGELYGN